MTEVHVLSTADWHSAVWTNKQNIAIRLARQGYSVTYLESLGLRRPRFNSADLKRLQNRLWSDRRNSGADTTSQSGHSNLRVVSPRIVPFHTARVARLYNHHYLASLTRARRGDNNFRILYTFSPVTYGVERHFDYTIYHSVDFLHAIPLIDETATLEDEARLVESADYVAGSSWPIVEHLKRQGAQQVSYWPNVTDTEHFYGGWGRRKPRALFAGNLTRTKIRIDWLLAAAESGIPLAIAGPYGVDGTADNELHALLSHSNVEYHGTLSITQLAELSGRCTVGLIPYELNQYTSGVFPMKVAEYLASGLSVVSTNLEALRADRTPEVKLVTTLEEFLDEVNAALQPKPADDASRKYESIRHRSWDIRISEIGAVIETARSQRQTTAS